MKNSSGLNQERNLHQIKQRLQDKTALNKYVAGFWCERQQEMHFFIIMDYGLIFVLKTSQWWICFSFCRLQMLTDGLEWCGLLWCFYQLFGLLFWRHPFTAEHPLLTHFYKPDEETHSSTSQMIWGWVNIQHTLIFIWTIFSKTNLYLYVDIFCMYI